MHITIVADPIDEQKAGVHFYTKNLIAELIKIDRENRYTLIHKIPNKFFDKLCEKYSNCKQEILKEKNHIGSGTIRNFFLLPKLFRKLKPDVVIETCHLGPFFTAKNCKRVTIIHDLTPILFPQFHIKGSVIRHKLLLKSVIKKADLIITPSENSKKDIFKYKKTKAKIAVIPPGIEMPIIEKPFEKPLNKFLRSGHLRNIKKKPRSLPYFLFLGTIEPRKNLELLITAFLELKKELELPQKLILAGGVGWKSKKFIKKYEKNPNIIFTNYVSKKIKTQLYKNAEIFIYPSIYEGFGIPPLEAMIQNTAVIVAKNSSLEEVYKNHAVLFKTQDKNDLKEKILYILENPKTRKDLIKNAYTFAKEFTWENAAKKTLEEIEKL